MKKFSDFKIEVKSTAFVGDKIKMIKILNREIEIVACKVENSNYPDKGDGKRLVLQIKMGEELRIVFTSSMSLRNQITQVPESGFPFMTTIIEENESFKLT